ncbi:hypothetical protein PC9H_007145 [Pleurotus ostreatus]|uniref:Uncharacterized protein n=1 Tax=Pleurotus ostreatus TaxID=5322 RepID=A0A8H6ZUC4_PLEOS|nr:uncharacterized protein PC9H_007145 [Pleurotus ostreatus]KAF7427928.1 hypothetical protein PC9H_007145 [Pleurotus ostreatus]
MHSLVNSLVLVFALGLHISPAFVAADTTVIPSNSFSSVSTFESFWNYLYPWGSDHNGTLSRHQPLTHHLQPARQIPTLLYITPVELFTLSLKLRLLLQQATQSPASSVPPLREAHGLRFDKCHRSYPPKSKLTLCSIAFTVTAVNSWPPEADIGEWKGTNDNWFNTFNTSSVVRSDLVAWPADLSFHSLKAVLKPESNGADVRIDFFMDNTLRATQFGKGFIGKALWLWKGALEALALQALRHTEQGT